MQQLELFNEARATIFDNITLWQHSHMLTEVTTTALQRFYCWDACFAVINPSNGTLYINTLVNADDVGEAINFVKDYHKDIIKFVEDL